MFTLQTSRLLLRDFVAEDWRAIYAMSQAPTVTRYQSLLRLSTEAEAQDWVQRAMFHNQLDQREAYNLAVVTQQDGQVIGWLGWGRSSHPEWGDLDFGYAALPACWGRGYMTEALQAAVAFMFDSLGARRVYGTCASSNVGSARVMEKAGLIRVAHWQEHDEGAGITEEHWRYATAEPAQAAASDNVDTHCSAPACR